MKNFWRILSYAKPYQSFIPQYIILTWLYVLFSLVNFTILKPLLEVLFDQTNPEVINMEAPSFQLSISFFTNTFYYYFGQFIEQNGKIGALKFVCLIIVISVFLSNLFRYLSGVMLASIRVRVLEKIRLDIFEKVTALHLGYFTEQKKGDIISRITIDIQEVQASVVNSLKILFKEPFLIIGYFWILFTMSPQLTLFTLLVLPISGGVIAYIAKRLKRKALLTQQSLGRIHNILDETISGMRIVKAFTATKAMNDKFGVEVKNNSRFTLSVFKKMELAGPISEFLGVLAVATILYIGGTMVLNKETFLSASSFITFLIIFSQVLNPAKAISNAMTAINKGLASSTRIFELIDTKPEIIESKNAIPINTFKSLIQYRDVCFSYDQEPVLTNINLEIKKGEIVALVGPSGGGKSTLADLLPRFYEPTSGMLSIDGKNINEYLVEDLRKLMGIVTQESILFNDTIKNNIAFGLNDVNESAIVKAAQVANAHEFIMENPEGYNTIVGERGMKLSGGQRQRLSIARAILKNPDILILDEATSALDSESEKLVQEALTNLMKDRTSIVIAHRLSTIQNADKIVVIEKGRIIQTGSHEELSNKKGLYQKLLKMQSF
ncbi:ABC transporter ATP-binding protein [Reichenbachiella sp. MALMAid0571]|uniref:ABC transporter ATP-binding protein n=1 Tax=Reichenbachiella sp. MALMAid0571 TaxID=3143939 RepID=UPI0032DF0AD2